MVCVVIEMATAGTNDTEHFVQPGALYTTLVVRSDERSLYLAIS